MSSSIARAPRKSRPKLSQPVLTDAQRVGITPLQYLLEIVRDDSIEAARRDRAAQAALPYCHARLAEKTKKAADAETAEKAGSDDAWAGDLEIRVGRSRPWATPVGQAYLTNLLARLGMWPWLRAEFVRHVGVRLCTAVVQSGRYTCHRLSAPAAGAVPQSILFVKEAEAPC
jgi:hypothetical protein